MSKRIAVFVVVLLTAACGTQAGKPAKSEAGLGGKPAPAAAPEAGAAAPQDQPLTTPEGSPTTIAQAVNQAAGAAGAAPAQGHTVTSGPIARYGAGTATGGGAGSSGAGSSG